MESYGKIMGLVEEVRDILNLHEVEGLSGKKRKAVIAKIKASHSAAKGHHPNVTTHVRKTLQGIKSGKTTTGKDGKKKKATQGHAGSTPHNPFKNIGKGKHLGGTSGEVAKKRGPSTTTPGTKAKKWRCRCANYHCICTGKAKENKGEIKHVEIDHGYKTGYNKRYKAWRKAHAGRYKPGGKAGFKKPAKSGTKRHTEA